MVGPARPVPLLAAAVLLVLAAPARATLLTNGNLDDPAIHESDLATGWTLLEGPDTTPDPPDVPEPANSATFATFANHTPGGERGLWLRSFVGNLNDAQPDAVFAHLMQTVLGVAGTTYHLTAWSRWETFYPGGVDNLNAEGTNGAPPDDGPASPTDTFLSLEFFDAALAPLPGSLVLDLRTEQTNDNVWRQHSLVALAPAGTALVRVRASLLDGVFNPGVNPQSAFFDDFELTSRVPEPAGHALLLAGLVGAAVLRRRRG